jgi:hypothetical protein
MFKDKVHEIKYVKDAEGKKGFNIQIKAGIKEKPVKLNDLISEHNPVNPRPIVVPIHNERARFTIFKYPFAKVELF